MCLTASVLCSKLSGAVVRAEIDERVDSALGRIKRGDLVRLRLIGKRPPELFIDTAAIESRWQNAFYHFEIKDEMGIRIDPEEYKLDRSLKGEFIRLVSAKTDLSDEENAKIIKAGLAALMGEKDEI